MNKYNKLILNGLGYEVEDDNTIVDSKGNKLEHTDWSLSSEERIIADTYENSSIRFQVVEDYNQLMIFDGSLKVRSEVLGNGRSIIFDIVHNNNQVSNNRDDVDLRIKIDCVDDNNNDYVNGDVSLALITIKVGDSLTTNPLILDFHEYRGHVRYSMNGIETKSSSDDYSGVQIYADKVLQAIEEYYDGKERKEAVDGFNIVLPAIKTFIGDYKQGRIGRIIDGFKDQQQHLLRQQQVASDEIYRKTKDIEKAIEKLQSDSIDITKDMEPYQGVQKEKQ